MEKLRKQELSNKCYEQTIELRNHCQKLADLFDKMAQGIKQNPDLLPCFRPYQLLVNQITTFIPKQPQKGSNDEIKAPETLLSSKRTGRKTDSKKFYGRRRSSPIIEKEEREEKTSKTEKIRHYKEGVKTEKESKKSSLANKRVHHSKKSKSNNQRKASHHKTEGKEVKLLGKKRSNPTKRDAKIDSKNKYDTEKIVQSPLSGIAKANIKVSECLQNGINVIGYSICVSYRDLNMTLGAFKSLSFAQDVKNEITKGLDELELNEKNYKKSVLELFEQMKEEIYKINPPIGPAVNCGYDYLARSSLLPPPLKDEHSEDNPTKESEKKDYREATSISKSEGEINCSLSPKSTPDFSKDKKGCQVKKINNEKIVIINNESSQSDDYK